MYKRQEYIQRSRPEKAVHKDIEGEYEQEELARKKGNKVVNIHATTQLQVVLVKPET